MSTDGGLRQLEMKHIQGCHWQPIETWSTGQGVPDINGCIDGIEFWIENKRTLAWSVEFDAMQIAWIERRIRNGGRVFIAVRRLTVAGPRKGKAVDELHVFHGLFARTLAQGGLSAAPDAVVFGEGGPARWPWADFRALLCNTK